MWLQPRSNFPREFILHVQQLANCARALLSPQAPASIRCNEFSADCECVANLAGFTYQDRAHSQILPGNPGIQFLALVTPHGAPCHYAHSVNLRQTMNDRLGDSVDQEFKLRQAARILKRQNGDRRFRRRLARNAYRGSRRIHGGYESISMFWHRLEETRILRGVTQSQTEFIHRCVQTEFEIDGCVWP